MTEQEALHIVRNPYGYSDQEVRFARLTVADALETLLERPMQRPAVLGHWIERGVTQMRALAPHAKADSKWLLGWLLANSNISAKRADEIMEMFEPIVYDGAVPEQRVPASSDQEHDGLAVSVQLCVLRDDDAISVELMAPDYDADHVWLWLEADGANRIDLSRRQMRELRDALNGILSSSHELPKDSSHE